MNQNDYIESNNIYFDMIQLISFMILCLVIIDFIEMNSDCSLYYSSMNWITNKCNKSPKQIILDQL